MQRREVLKAGVAGIVAAFGWPGFVLAKEYFPVQVDENLFQGINRVKNPADETKLEKLHSPVITAPEKVKAGEIFNVSVRIGSILHPMIPTHWIEHLQLNLGNEPAGTLMFRSRGYMKPEGLKPEGQFNLVLGDDFKGKTASIVVQIKCNLHGIWQDYRNLEVV